MPFNEVGGQRSEVGGQRSEVRGRKSEVGGQKSEVSERRKDGQAVKLGIYRCLKREHAMS